MKLFCLLPVEAAISWIIKENGAVLNGNECKFGLRNIFSSVCLALAILYHDLALNHDLIL